MNRKFCWLCVLVGSAISASLLINCGLVDTQQTCVYDKTFETSHIVVYSCHIAKDGINGNDGTPGAQGATGPGGAVGPQGLPGVIDTSLLYDPCGNAPGINDETFIVIQNGIYKNYLASFSANANGDYTRFALLEPGSYITTDGSNCFFNIDTNGEIQHEHY